MHKRKIIYVAGPLTAVDTALCVARTLYNQGHIPFVPHTHLAGWRRLFSATDADFMRCDCHFVERFDGIYLLPGWESGAGARTEAHVALRECKEFFGPVTKAAAMHALGVRHDAERIARSHE